ncbi:BA75_00140T0 [Komagataella pastoris]|uniref:BA75_00140T0 n=1 Tax=Komagataella pastoris TaxID=4922 RepID=A0A1B2J5C9_PICPA|nr:BA75_00140T0 [Komagataella pastoris]
MANNTCVGMMKGRGGEVKVTFKQVRMGRIIQIGPPQQIETLAGEHGKKCEIHLSVSFHNLFRSKDMSLEKLRQQPTLKELNEVLDELLPIISDSAVKESVKLDIRSTLITVTVRQIYPDLSNLTRRKLAMIFQGAIGIKLLISSIQHAEALEVKCSLCDLLIIFFHDESLLESIFESNIRQARSLLFGSTVFNVLNETYQEVRQYNHPVTENLQEITTLKGYTSLVLPTLVVYLKKERNPQLLLAALQLCSPNESQLVFDHFFQSPERFSTLVLTYTAFIPAQKPVFIKALLSYLISRYSLQAPQSLGNLQKVRNVLSHFLWDNWSSFFITVLDYQNLSLLKVYVKLINKDQVADLLKSLIPIWGAPTFINKTSLTLQKHYLYLIVLLLSHEPATNTEISSDHTFLTTITNRIDSTSLSVRAQGMLLANLVLQNSDGQNKKVFNMKEQDDYESTFFKDLGEELKDLETLELATSLAPDICSLQLQTESRVEKITEVTTVASQNSNLYIVSDDELSDPEDSDDDDPSVSRKDYPTRPVYIKELLQYLLADEKDSKAFDKLEVALKVAPTLIRQKSSFGDEIKHFTNELLATLVGLSNRFEMENFDQQRINSIISIIVNNSEHAITELLNLFLTGDYSLQQRLIILTSLSLAARELKGHLDENVTRSFNKTKTEFASSLLPKRIHDQFIELEQKQKDLFTFDQHAVQQLEDEYLSSTIQSAEKNIMPHGKVLRVSRGLELKKAQKSHQSSKNRKKEFFKVVGPKFFFPLATTWHALNSLSGFKIGRYSPILTSHFIRTMALILDTAYPSAPDLLDMIQEMVSILIPLKNSYFDQFNAAELIDKGMNDELLILDSLVLSFLVILQNTNQEFLLQNYGQELSQISDWLQNILETVIDDGIRRKCAGVLVSINNLFRTV